MSLDQAKLYLAKVLPWPQANETPAFVNIHWTVQGQDGKPFWTGRAVQSVHDAIRALDWALKLPDTRDVYACMSMQRTANEKVSQKGNKYFAPIRNQQGAVALKSLFVDIDLKGGDHGYNTEAEVQAALAQFLKDTGLPEPSLMVASGGGFHVYWTMDTALPPEEWKPLAHALAEATKRHGLKCDTQCTIDTARVLRIPDTFNRKQGTPRSVTLVSNKDYDYTVERIAKPLAAYKTTTPSQPNTNTLAPGFTPRPAIADELGVGIEQPKHAPIDPRSVANECAFIKQAIVTGGKDYTNPMWMLTTLLATFMEKPRQMAHMMANSHPGYTKESTDELFDRKLKDRDEKSLGWPQCKTISASGCKACQTCPHFAAAKSPFNFANRAAPITLVAPSPLVAAKAAGAHSDLPLGYQRLPNGVIAVPMMTADGATDYVPICDYKMLDPQLQKDPWVLHFTSSVERGKDKQISLPCELINTQNMRGHLQKLGFMVPGGDKGASTLARFFVSWIKQLQETRDSVVAAPFGWSLEPSTQLIEGFVFGGQLWTPGAPKLAAHADSTIARAYNPSGDIQKWVAAAKLITQQVRPALQAIVAAAFAGPLVRFTGLDGLMMHAYSIESGIGKSTAMKVAQSVWGHPKNAGQTLDDSYLSVTNKLGILRSIPLFWDEIQTKEQNKKLVNILFTTTGGREKTRLNRNIEQREPGNWQTLVVSAANDSLLDCVIGHTQYTEAGMLRIFEFVVPPAVPGSPGQLSPSQVSIAVSQLNDHFAKVGLEYAKWLGAHFHDVEQDMKDFLDAHNARVNATPDERFWNATIACIMLGAKYANQLGLVQFDLAGLDMLMIDTLDKLRETRKTSDVGLNKDMNVSNLLAQFVNDHRATNTLRTNRIHVGQGKPTHIQIVKTDVHRLGAIVIHMGVDDKLMRISSTKLTGWLKDRGYARHAFMQALTKEFGARPLQGIMGAGTQFAGMKEYVIELDLNGTEIANFIEV